VIFYASADRIPQSIHELLFTFFFHSSRLLDRPQQRLSRLSLYVTIDLVPSFSFPSALSVYIWALYTCRNIMTHSVTVGIAYLKQEHATSLLRGAHRLHHSLAALPLPHHESSSAASRRISSAPNRQRKSRHNRQLKSRAVIALFLK
jgi:hypothetical protein